MQCTPIGDAQQAPLVAEKMFTITLSKCNLNHLKFSIHWFAWNSSIHIYLY